ncbi:hypothetical protein FGO68_gene17112 [Halteria grandinella]|uniref:Uncharacterized protein n=1 Tax=Halteria grandinella TaxID=5974 RepID=A0A8J8NTG3_HALGN|nr:hypothetical protein FGO68_gene17112 [Halteria grandinella]
MFTTNSHSSPLAKDQCQTPHNSLLDQPSEPSHSVCFMEEVDIAGIKAEATLQDKDNDQLMIETGHSTSSQQGQLPPKPDSPCTTYTLKNAPRVAPGADNFEMFNQLIWIHGMKCRLEPGKDNTPNFELGLMIDPGMSVRDNITKLLQQWPGHPLHTSSKRHGYFPTLYLIVKLQDEYINLEHFEVADPTTGALYINVNSFKYNFSGLLMIQRKRDTLVEIPAESFMRRLDQADLVPVPQRVSLLEYMDETESQYSSPTVKETPRSSYLQNMDDGNHSPNDAISRQVSESPYQNEPPEEHPLYTLATAPRVVDNGRNFTLLDQFIAIEGVPHRYRKLRQGEQHDGPDFELGLYINPSKSVSENIKLILKEWPLQCDISSLYILVLHGVEFTDLRHFEREGIIDVDAFSANFKALVMVKRNGETLQEEAPLSVHQPSTRVPKPNHRRAVQHSIPSHAPSRQAATGKLETVLTTQHAFLKDLFSQKHVYPDLPSFEANVLDRLNQISANEGVKSFFTTNGREGNKYVSLKCSGCKQGTYVWFTQVKGPEGPQKITFCRYPYGHSMHLDTSTHK